MVDPRPRGGRKTSRTAPYPHGPFGDVLYLGGPKKSISTGFFSKPSTVSGGVGGPAKKKNSPGQSKQKKKKKNGRKKKPPPTGAEQQLGGRAIMNKQTQKQQAIF